MARPLLIWLCTGLLAMAACSGGSDLEATAVDLDALADAPVRTIDGQDAPSVEVSAGAIWFATPWCRQCDGQLGEVLAAADAQCDATVTVVLGRAGDGAIAQFVDANTIDTTCADGPRIVIDPSGAAFGSVPVITAPTWVFVDAEGSARVQREPLAADAIVAELATVSG